MRAAAYRRGRDRLSGRDFHRFADYWIVRQSDAHAWNEVWIEGRGWLRIDPTSAIAPGRVNTA